MDRRTFLGWSSGFLAGLVGLFVSRRASGRSSELETPLEGVQAELERWGADPDYSLVYGESIKRAPGCKCHWEEGDSPCPVHGEDEG